MTEFLGVAGQFPTIIYSFFLVFVCIYWVFSCFGFLSLDDLVSDLELESLSALLMKFGLNGAPFSLIISFSTLFAWLISYYLSFLLLQFQLGSLIHSVIAIGIVVVAFFSALWLCSFAIRPFRSLFQKLQLTQDPLYLLGSEVTVRTSRVDQEFGEATYNKNGIYLILKVRAHSNESFSSGQEVVLLEYHEETNTYLVSEKKYL